MGGLSALLTPELIRGSVSPGPWVERTLFTAKTRCGLMPDHARHNELSLISSSLLARLWRAFLRLSVARNLRSTD